jgi:hypothetical protein
MCGIAGKLSLSEPVEQPLLERTCRPRTFVDAQVDRPPALGVRVA